MNIALFTGAGASRAIGYPLTRDFLPRILDGIKNKTLYADLKSNPKAEHEDRVELHRYMKAIMPGLNELNSTQLPLVTDLFSLVEYSILANEALPIGGENELRRFRELLKQAITDIILEDFETGWDLTLPENEKGQHTLKKLVKWIKNNKNNVGLISTNYDIGIEFELYPKSSFGDIYEDIDLGYDFRDPSGKEYPRPKKPKLRVYKLHGSIDTLRCQSCGYVYFNADGAIVHHAFQNELVPENLCHCRNDIRLDLHIVSPSLVREIKEPNLLNTWKSALNWLRNSEHWIIVGYSLPPEDHAIRSLLIRAYATSEKKPAITVVQYGNDVQPRYRALFPECEYFDKGLEDFLEKMF